MERSGRSEDSEPVRTPTLVELCCVSLAKAVNNGKYDRESLESLPGELSERLLGSLSAQSMLTNESLLCVASPHLRSLNVANMKQRASHPDELCTSLDELNCHGCAIDDSVLDLIYASPFSSELRVLDLSSCSGVTSSALKSILLHCTRLETLNISGCPITDDAFDILDISHSGPVPRSALKRKYDTVCDLMAVCSVPEEDFVPVERSHKRAKHEDTLIMDVMTPVAVASKVSTSGRPMVHMRSLNISGCCSVTNAGLQLISKLFPYLTRFDCSHIDTNDNLDIRPLLTNCAFIKSVNINGCRLDMSESFLDNGTLALEEISFCGTGTLNNHFHDLLEKCAPSLRVLRLRNKSFATRNADGRPQDPTTWLQQCRSLVTLDLYSVSVGESALSQLLSTRCRDTLEVLDITHCHVLESDLQQLCNTFLPRLRSLSLNHVAISQWTSDLSRNCPLLTHLCINLDLKALLPERDVPQLLQGLDQLRELELWCCKSLSRPTVLSILEMCPNLRCLLLSTANSEEAADDEDIDMADEDSDWSDDEEVEKRVEVKPVVRHEHAHDHDHDHAHGHAHGCHAASWLSDAEFSQLTQSYPHVQFKIWHHTISGNRHFRFHNGDTPQDKIERLITPLKVNELGVRLKVNTSEDGAHDIVPMILVDNIPIWSHETSASLHHLRKTTDGHDGGALPLISEWCCECNIESYNGVLFYHDADNVFWETHEPGVKQRFRFSKGQYITAINNARLQYMQLAWQLQRLRWVHQQQKQNETQQAVLPVPCM